MVTVCREAGIRITRARRRRHRRIVAVHDVTGRAGRGRPGQIDLIGLHRRRGEILRLRRRLRIAVRDHGKPIVNAAPPLLSQVPEPLLKSQFKFGGIGRNIRRVLPQIGRRS